MSFIIKGKEPPSCCAACNRDLAAIAGCVYTRRLVLPEDHDMRSGRHPRCPLAEIPDPGAVYADHGCFWIIEGGKITIIPAEDKP